MWIHFIYEEKKCEIWLFVPIHRKKSLIQLFINVLSEVTTNLKFSTKNWVNDCSLPFCKAMSELISRQSLLILAWCFHKLKYLPWGSYWTSSKTKQSDWNVWWSHISYRKIWNVLTSATLESCPLYITSMTVSGWNCIPVDGLGGQALSNGREFTQFVFYWFLFVTTYAIEYFSHLA